MARAVPSTRLIFYTLGLTYIATGIIGALPGASLIQLASDTNVSLEVVGGIFTVSAFGFLLGAIFAGTMVRYTKPKYLLASGLFLLAVGAVSTALATSFPVLLVSQGAKGLGFGFIDISLNTIATIAFHKALSENLNNIHGMYGLGALTGPLILAFALQFFASMPLAYFVGAFVALCASTLLLVQRVPDRERAAKGEQREQARATDARERRAALRQGLLWLLVLQISIYTSAEVGFGNWIVTAVSKSAHVSLVLAAPVATAFFIGLTTGRLGGAQLLKRGWLTETSLLYTALLGGALCSGLVAIFSAQPLIAYGASALVGCFYGPLFPSLMARASRRFIHAIGPVSTMMMIGTGTSSMIIPATMGLLIPVIGIHWVMTIPLFCCLIVIVPMTLSNRSRPVTAQVSLSEQTARQEVEPGHAS